MIPFYTQISGTSMATPFIAGTIALMLDADPTLNPDEIKQIIQETASRMPGYEDYEVGAGYVNAYAAVDKVFNRSKNYRSFQNVSFNAVFGEERPAAQNFHIDFNPANSGPTSTNAKTFTVEPNINVLDMNATVDTELEEGTGNLVGIRINCAGRNELIRRRLNIRSSAAADAKSSCRIRKPERGLWKFAARAV